MKNRVYYGEYTLKHWIKLILTENIVLPEYQRKFVWSEKDVKRLVQSIKDGQFIPPVTISLYNDNVNNKKNLIIDGQQRLTSLLLVYLGYFPDRKKFESTSKNHIAVEDDSANDETIDNQSGIIWRFSELTKYGKTKELILESINKDNRYIKLSESLYEIIDDNFFTKNCLGFSYIVPNTTEVSEIQRNFSQLFRNINYFGKKLDAMDSRKSLYYQDNNLTNYFEGKCADGQNVLGDLMLIENLQPCKIDFVRYLSILSQYNITKRNDAKDIMTGYSAYSSRESYYADYVSFILGLEQEDRNEKFDGFDFAKTFPNNCWSDRYNNLRMAIIQLKTLMPLKNNTLFSTWYEADFWLFGLIYFCVFKNKMIKYITSRIDENANIITLKQEIEDKINEAKNNPTFSKNVNRLSFVRIRLLESINIYENYVQE